MKKLLFIACLLLGACDTHSEDAYMPSSDHKEVLAKVDSAKAIYPVEHNGDTYLVKRDGTMSVIRKDELWPVSMTIILVITAFVLGLATGYRDR